jgi:homoserine O-succinyltransferase
MPVKIDHRDAARARCSATAPLQVNFELLHTRPAHASKNTLPEHLVTFYKTFDEVRDRSASTA